MPTSLDRDGEPALVFGACAGLAARFDLASFCKKPAHGGYVLVVDDLGLLKAESAYFTPWRKTPATISSLALTALPSSGST